MFPKVKERHIRTYICSIQRQHCEDYLKQMDYKKICEKQSKTKSWTLHK